MSVKGTRPIPKGTFLRFGSPFGADGAGRQAWEFVFLDDTGQSVDVRSLCLPFPPTICAIHLTSVQAGQVQHYGPTIKLMGRLRPPSSLHLALALVFTLASVAFGGSCGHAPHMCWAVTHPPYPSGWSTRGEREGERPNEGVGRRKPQWGGQRQRPVQVVSSCCHPHHLPLSVTPSSLPALLPLHRRMPRGPHQSVKHQGKPWGGRRGGGAMP